MTAKVRRFLQTRTWSITVGTIVAICAFPPWRIQESRSRGSWYAGHYSLWTDASKIAASIVGEKEHRKNYYASLDSSRMSIEVVGVLLLGILMRLWHVPKGFPHLSLQRVADGSYQGHADINGRRYEVLATPDPPTQSAESCTPPAASPI